MSSGSMTTAGLISSPRWNPYLVGIAIGLLSWVVFAVVNAPLGITTSLSAVAGAVAEPVMGEAGLKANPYWAKNMPALDYGTLFIVGTFLGALVGALLSKDFKIEVVPQIWKDRFGSSRSKRLVVAFGGGILAMYGARMAGGCTSGNGLSGSLQLAVSGWTFFLVMFAAGTVTAFAMFGRTPSPRD